MHKKVLTKPTLILLYGFPGTGKTFFARQFKDSINAALVNSDQLRFEFFSDPNYSKQENEVVNHLSYYMIEQFLQSGNSVIYDADTATYGERRVLYEIAFKLKIKAVVVWIQVDVESAFNRVVTRDRRRSDDKFSRQLDRTSFENIINHSNNPTSREDYVVVSGKHTFVTQKNAVFKKLYESGLLAPETASSNIVKPNLVNRVPNPLAGRVDASRRNIIIR